MLPLAVQVRTSPPKRIPVVADETPCCRRFLLKLLQPSPPLPTPLSSTLRSWLFGSTTVLECLRLTMVVTLRSPEAAPLNLYRSRFRAGKGQRLRDLFWEDFPWRFRRVTQWICFCALRERLFDNQRTPTCGLAAPADKGEGGNLPKRKRLRSVGYATV